MTTRAVFFDVDFTLIYPGPTFQGVGYREFCAAARRHASMRWRSSVRSPPRRRCSTRTATSTIRRSSSSTRCGSSRQMGGAGAGRRARGARDLRRVVGLPPLRDVRGRARGAARAARVGLKIGLISNTQRSLTAFQTHFALEGIFAAAVSSLRPRLHEAAPQHLRSGAAAGRRHAARGGDGRRQPAGRHRRRPRAGDARGAGLALRASRPRSTPARRTCRSSSRSASCRPSL